MCRCPAVTQAVTQKAVAEHGPDGERLVGFDNAHPGGTAEAGLGAERVKVADREVCIIGSKSNLLQALSGGPQPTMSTTSTL